MCGIAGIQTSSPQRLGSIIAAMTDALRHRGPDDWGYLAAHPGLRSERMRSRNIPESAGTVFLGHRRLSIIDIAGSCQPLCNEDGSVWTVFNGEIYNYRELTEVLTGKGHIFRDKGDTEVLVHLWEEYGEEMTAHLVGMFAFAIYDSTQDHLFLARDRFGQKPLYYFGQNDTFAFASELQAFWRLSCFDHENISHAAMANYFRYGYVPSPKTINNDVASLLPGTTLLRSNGVNRTSRYWKPSAKGMAGAVDFDELQNLLDESVRLQLRSDVPLGSFLSGGIDSSLVTASMTRQLPGKVRTFTISTGRNNWCDESAVARTTASFLMAEHHEIMVEPEFAEVSHKLAAHYGQPYADHSSILTYYVSRETRNLVKVALTGDGGDKLFGGYSSYTNSWIYAITSRIPPWIRIPLAQTLQHVPMRCGRLQSLPDSVISANMPPVKGENIACLFHAYWRKLGFDEEFVKTLSQYREDELDVFSKYFREAASSDATEKWMETDQRMYLADDILVKVDIASMASSLECRAPFLDHRLAEYANSLSINEKLKNGTTKYPLRRLAEKCLPKGTANLPKKGFSMPLGKWMREELKDWVHSLIFDDTSAWEPYLREEAVRRLWREHQSGRLDHQSRLWLIAALSLWRKSASEAKSR